MLSKKQKQKIYNMVLAYKIGMQETHKVSPALLEAWAQRYRIAIEQELQKQYKR